ncbi:MULTISPECIES: DUF6328 family protein [unclassified Pseudofrankia]|uniref:DUF6328 family protein n=1 Tax=unclassified Pseudofrankia TaxID=2994372 RepID=UPI0009F6C643|nr:MULTISPECIES: DUF6328 family protein [unclassified Pseudofrankia]MDT3438710.1 DUF6328 family protein [Pseudofrankia sp. BMG5.37]
MSERSAGQSPEAAGRPGQSGGPAASGQRVPSADSADSAAGHSGETPDHRRDRNWTELLQELRVAQTGVQLLTAFLLALPFQAKFSDLSSAQRGLYLVVVLLAVAATGLLLMPVSLHRAVFRRHQKELLIQAANALAQAGLALLALAVAGVVTLIFDVVVGPTAGIIAGALTLLVLVLLWAVIPAIVRKQADAQTPPESRPAAAPHDRAGPAGEDEDGDGDGTI